jgi:hypothetical protein
LGGKRCRESRKYISNCQQTPLDSVNDLLKNGDFHDASNPWGRGDVKRIKPQSRMSVKDSNRRYLLWFIIAVIIALIPWVILF